MESLSASLSAAFLREWGSRGVARQHPCPAPLTCASAVSSSLDLLLCLHPVPLPLRAHWILNDGSVSPTPTLGHSRAYPLPPPQERRQDGL